MSDVTSDSVAYQFCLYTLTAWIDCCVFEVQVLCWTSDEFDRKYVNHHVCLQRPCAFQRRPGHQEHAKRWEVVFTSMQLLWDGPGGHPTLHEKGGHHMDVGGKVAMNKG